MIPDTAKDRAIRRRVITGTASNIAGQSFVFAISFLLTPFILDQLGAPVYGLWVLLNAIIAYSAILDFGIWGTVIKYVAEYQAQGNHAGARTFLSTVLYLYLGIAVLISMGGWIAAPFVPRLFHLAPEDYSLASSLVILISLSTACAIPCMLPLAVLRGLQRYDIVNAIDVLTALITAAATVAVLWMGGGAMGLAVVNIVSLFCALSMGIWALRHVAPDLPIGWRAARWHMARTVLAYSWPLSMRDIANRLQTRTDEITIGVFLPVSAVGAYSIARRLSETTQTLTRQFMKTLLPLASQLHAEEDYPRLRAVYKTGTRLTTAIVFALGSVLFMLAGPILAVWIRAEYAAYAGIVALLTLANLFATIQWPAVAMLQAMSRHRILAISSMGNGIANVILSVLLVRPYGLAGVALGTVIPAAIECICVILPYSMRVARIPARDTLLEIFIPALIPAAPTILILYALRTALEPASVLSIAVIAAAGLAVYAIGYLGLEIRIRARRRQEAMHA